MTRSLRCIVSLVMLAAVLIPATASAQAEDEPFRRGLNARGDKKWSEVALAMRQAIAINRMESTRKIQGGSRLNPFGRSTEYLPHYLLGEALRNTGDCAGAVFAWETSEEQKVVLGLPEYENVLRAGLKECNGKGVLLRAEFNQQMSLTDQGYNETVALLQRVEKVKETNQDLWRPDVQTEVDRARADLTLAQKVNAKARQTRMVVDFAESRTIALRAGNVLRPIEAKLIAALGTRKQLELQVAESHKVLDGADGISNSIDAVKVTLPPNLVAARDGARAIVGRARERVGQAEKTENTTTGAEAVRLAYEASDALTKVLDQVKKFEREESAQRLLQALQTANEQFSFVGNSLATLERLVAEKPTAITPEMSSQRAAIVKEYSTLQRRLENARRSENLNGVQDATKLVVEARTRIDALIQMFGPATLRDRGVNEALEQGARHYLAGEYQQAISSLEPLANRTDIPLQVHLHVFRAASLYALYIHSGEKDQALLTNALAEVRRCKEIDAAFQPYPRAFTPRFLTFYQAAGASGSQAPPPSQ